MKIVILEPLEADLSSYLNNNLLKNHEVIYYSTKDVKKETLIKRIDNADIIVSDNTPLGEDILSNDKNLKALFIAFSGLDHINLNYCKENNIEVFNASGYSTEAVSELTLMFILLALRKFNELSYKNKVIGKEFPSLTIGLFGMGFISKRLIELLKPFKIKIIYNSLKIHNEIENENIKYVSKEELLKNSDIISLHIPLNENNKNFISFKEFEMMKNNAILINTARGALINKEALINSLKENKISMYLSDVFEKEPPLNDDYELLKFKNVIINPHIGYYTFEAMEKRAKIIFDKLFDYIKK